MDRLEHIAKLGEFIPHGDDSFIDDQGISNRWAERRRARATAQQVRDEQIRLVRAEFDRQMAAPEPTAFQCDMAMEEYRNGNQEEIDLEIDQIIEDLEREITNDET